MHALHYFQLKLSLNSVRDVGELFSVLRIIHIMHVLMSYYLLILYAPPLTRNLRETDETVDTFIGLEVIIWLQILYNILQVRNAKINFLERRCTAQHLIYTRYALKRVRRDNGLIGKRWCRVLDCAMTAADGEKIIIGDLTVSH